MANAKGKKPTKPTVKDDELELDDEMPEDDDVESEDEVDDEDDSDDDDDSDAEDEDEDDQPDVIVTQPSTASSEPVTLATAYSLMDLVEASSDETFDTILEEANLNGKHAFYQGKQVCAVLKQDDGLYTIYLWKGSVPGKSYNDCDGALDIKWDVSKTKLDFPITWNADGNGCFTAKVCAFEGQAEFGADFVFVTDSEADIIAQVMTDHELSFDANELETYAKAALWTGKVAAWFTKTHVEVAGPEPE